MFTFGFGGMVFWTNSQKQEQKKKFKFRGGLLSQVAPAFKDETQILLSFPGPCISGDPDKVYRALQKFVDRMIDSVFQFFFFSRAR